jgi:hypothetical protein
MKLPKWTLFGAVLGASFLTSVFACSSSSTPSPVTNPNPYNVCSMPPLSQSACPSTYSAALSQCESDNASGRSLGDMAGTCGGVLLVSIAGPFGNTKCSYDPTTKALVGALDQNGDVEGDGGCLGSSSGESIPTCNFTNLDCSPPDGGTLGGRQPVDAGAKDAGAGTLRPG